MNHSTPGLPVHHQLPESTQTHMSIELVMPSNHVILCHPLLFLPSIFSNIRVFSNESTLRMRWLKYWSFSFNISPSNEHPGLISFSMDWLDLLAVQGTLKSLLQHRSLKASILWCSAFFIVQLSHPYMATGKTIAFYPPRIYGMGNKQKNPNIRNTQRRRYIYLHLLQGIFLTQRSNTGLLHYMQILYCLSHQGCP